MDLNGNYGVSIVPKITGGFQDMPIMPRLSLFPMILPQAILIAFICYASTWSLQKMYAKKHGYEVYPNQELLAIGLANVGSSFFLCFPGAAGLGRSAVQDKLGRTQLASLISSALIVLFILFLSPFLATLPQVCHQTNDIEILMK